MGIVYIKGQKRSNDFAQVVHEVEIIKKYRACQRDPTVKGGALA